MTNEIRYRLADAVSIYDNGQGYLLIVLGQRGQFAVYRIDK